MRWDLFGYIFAGCLAALLLAAFFGMAPTIPWTSTRYAPGFSERAFADVSVGTSVQTVRQSLGEPLSILTNNQGSAWWFYSEPGWFSSGYRKRTIVLSNDVVIEKAIGVE